MNKVKKNIKRKHLLRGKIAILSYVMNEELTNRCKDLPGLPELATLEEQLDTLVISNNGISHELCERIKEWRLVRNRYFHRLPNGIGKKNSMEGCIREGKAIFKKMGLNFKFKDYSKSCLRHHGYVLLTGINLEKRVAAVCGSENINLRKYGNKRSMSSKLNALILKSKIKISKLESKIDSDVSFAKRIKLSTKIKHHKEDLELYERADEFWHYRNELLHGKQNP